jgi:hypothetical protein
MSYEEVMWALMRSSKWQQLPLPFLAKNNSMSRMRMVKKSEGRRLQGILKRKWKNGIKIDIRKMGWDGRCWYGLD